MNAYDGINKRLVLVAMISLFVVGSLSAQPGGGRGGPPALPDEEGIQQMVDELTKALSLTEAQEAKVLQLYTDHFEAAGELMESGRPDREAMEALRQDLEEQVGDVLDDEQQEAYEKLMEEQRPQSGGQRPQRGGRRR